MNKNKKEHPEGKTTGEDVKGIVPTEEKEEPSSLEKLQGQLEEKTREAAEQFDKWLRLRAEMENYKKRMQKEKSDLLKYGNETLLKAILPALDNLDRAIEHGQNTPNNASLLEGVEITRKQILNILESFGVKPVSVLGESFDPEKHEAVFQQESDQEPNRVLVEVQKGYSHQDRLLRPAKVIVSKARVTEERAGE